MSKLNQISTRNIIQGSNITFKRDRQACDEINHRMTTRNIPDTTLQPNFDPRNYGFQKLTPLIISTGNFEVEQRENTKSRHKLIYVKNKEKRKTRSRK